MTSKKYFFTGITSIYFFLGLLFYYITDSKPISFIFKNIFKSDISFLVKKKTETINKYINLFDEKYFNLLLIFPLLILIFFSIIKLKSILLEKKIFNFKTESSDIDYLNKYNLNYLIAVAAGLGLYLELMIIRLHSSFFQLFGFFKNISLLSCLLGLGVGYLFSSDIRK